MPIHKFVQKHKLWNGYKFNRSWTYWLYPEGDKEAIAQVSFQAVVRKFELIDFGFHIHVGNKGSETPWDGSVRLFGAVFHWSYTRGRRLAHFLTNGRHKDRYWRRDIHLETNFGRIYWTLWGDRDGSDYVKGQHPCARKHYPKWRHGSVKYNPLDYILGTKQYTYSNVGHSEMITLRMPEDEYHVKVQIQEMFRGRSKVKKKESQGYCLDIDAPKGVPTHVDHSGGYKGDRTYGWSIGFPVTEDGNVLHNWTIRAQQLIEADVLKSRGKSGFVKPDVP